MIDRNNRPEPAAKLYFVIARRQVKFTSQWPAAESKPQKRTVGREGVSLLERTQPGPNVERTIRHLGVDAIEANRPAQRGEVRHGIRTGRCRQAKATVEQPIPHCRG